MEAILGDEDIVISGISGRFPESANLDEFWDNLYHGVDMVTEITDRWDVESFATPRRMGQLKDLDRFDASFMGVHGRLAQQMDPRLRILLELTHEAIVDAGVNPATIRGSRTGVYVGSSGEESLEILKSPTDVLSGYSALGSMPPMLSNRISFTYDLKGPSMTIDTACSSSFSALHQALLAIRTGICDSAIVAGIHLCLDPRITLMYTSLGMTSAEGKCRSFDAAAEGYVRSEAAVVLYLTKNKLSRRSYATILHAKTNVDGYKTQGITFPSGNSQEELLREVYAEAGVNPKDVDYVEAHATGTRAGDPEEVNAIARVFCEGRDPEKPLLIGAVKSNMGHPEPASGVCQIAKVLLAHQHGVIPGNLHYSTPNPDIPALLDGRIKVVDENTDFNGSLVGISSFGFGGANAHVLLKLTPRIGQVRWESKIPLIFPFSGRTAEVELSLEKLLRTKDPQLVALLQEIAQNNIPGHNYRSYAIQHENETQVKVAEIESREKRPIWFIFSGFGTQYIGMVQDMMNFQIFRESVQRSIPTMKKHEFDLAQVLYSDDEHVFDDGLNSMCAVTSIQVALVDLLNALGIVPEGIIGHSLGEVASAYADGCLTAEQTVLVSLMRGRAFNKSKIPGAMASVGFTWEEAERRCPKGVYPACHNSIDNVTVSGPDDLVAKFVKELEDEGVFVRNVHSSGFPFHSIYMKPTEPYVREYLAQIILDPIERTSRWISTSVPEAQKNSDLDKFCSVDYFVNNAIAQVRFHSAMQLVPTDAIAIEVAPHNLMQAILKRQLPPSVSCIGLMNRKALRKDLFFLDSIGQIYLKGRNPNFSVLYTQPNFPSTSATSMISPAIRWDHSESWFVPSFQNKSSKSGGHSIRINLKEEANSFYAGHCLNDQVTFPATGYIWLVWTAFAKKCRKNIEELPVVFENLRFERIKMLPESGDVEFFVVILPDNGDFEVYETDSAVCRGRIREFGEHEDMLPEFDDPSGHNHEAMLETADFYKELRLRGYHYSGVFRGVRQAGLDGKWAELEWQNNWVGFLDTFLQIALLQHRHRGLYVPISLQKAIIDPAKFLSFQSNNETIRVKNQQLLKTLKGPGLEFRGLKTSILTRKPTIAIPKLSKQKFVPYAKDTFDISLQHCLEYFFQIVADNATGQDFVIAEFPSDNKNCIGELFSPNLPTRFVKPVIFVISDDTLGERSYAGVQTLPTKKYMSVKNPNLVVISKESLHLANNLVPEDGFLLIQDGVREAYLSGYTLVSHKLQMSLQLYRRRSKEFLRGNKQVIKVSNSNFDWAQELRGLVVQSSSKVIVYSDGSGASGILGLVRCLLSEGHDNVRCFYVKDENNNLDFEKPSKELKQQIELDLVFNVYESGEWGCYCDFSMTHEELSLPRSVAESYADVLQPGDLSSLKWIESPLSLERDDKSNICQVHHSSLNFRDVMLATGKLFQDALPGDLSFQDGVLGMEFAGVMNERNVFGIQGARCLATSVKIDNCGLLWEVPENWTLAEAATVPVAYATAYYSLLVRGRMRKGETVLVHAGYEDVGQAAIAVALSRKCKVITTVNTVEKQQFLYDRFPELQVSCIEDSRNGPIFENHVMEVTGGRGVDIILNSLPHKLDDSFRCLAKGGRFLVLGKLDMLNSTALGVDILFDNVNFQSILLDDVIYGASDDREEIAELIRDGIKSGVVRPLPYVLFSNNQLQEAFRFMAIRKDMGKVVVSVRDPPQIPSLPRTYFHSHKSYVLVGGLQELGLEVGNWMVTRGARNLVFVSKSGFTNGVQPYRVKLWRDQGVQVVINNSDVSTHAGASSALKAAEVLGPVGGVFILAFVPEDAMRPSQTDDSLEVTSKAQIKATMELDTASRNLTTPDYFVAFTIIDSSRRNAGQFSYTFANELIERLCEERCQAGLPGLVIKWGHIAGYEAPCGLMDDNDVAVAGVMPQKLQSCLETLDLFLQQTHPVVCSCVPASTKFWNEQAAKTLVDLVAHVLAIKDIAKINMKATFVEHGMDSLMAAEIKTLLENEKKIAIPVADIGQLTFSKLREMESCELNADVVDAAIG